LTKAILERYNIKDSIEIILEKGQIILKPISKPRKGWDIAFKNMHKNGEDHLLMNDVFDDENFDEWN
jgi:antitoxin MazE